jgi:hypothetical protein
MSNYILYFVGSFGLDYTQQSTKVTIPAGIQDVFTKVSSPDTKQGYWLGGYYNLLVTNSEIPFEYLEQVAKLPLKWFHIHIPAMEPVPLSLEIEFTKPDWLSTVTIDVYANTLLYEEELPYLDEGMY